jgi:hypothetical protein
MECENVMVCRSLGVHYLTLKNSVIGNAGIYEVMVRDLLARGAKGVTVANLKNKIDGLTRWYRGIQDRLRGSGVRLADQETPALASMLEERYQLLHEIFDRNPTLGPNQHAVVIGSRHSNMPQVRQQEEGASSTSEAATVPHTSAGAAGSSAGGASTVGWADLPSLPEPVVQYSPAANAGRKAKRKKERQLAAAAKRASQWTPAESMVNLADTLHAIYPYTVLYYGASKNQKIPIFYSSHYFLPYQNFGYCRYSFVLIRVEFICAVIAVLYYFIRYCIDEDEDEEDHEE